MVIDTPDRKSCKRVGEARLYSDCKLTLYLAVLASICEDVYLILWPRITACSRQLSMSLTTNRKFLDILASYIGTSRSFDPARGFWLSGEKNPSESSLRRHNLSRVLNKR